MSGIAGRPGRLGTTRAETGRRGFPARGAAILAAGPALAQEGTFSSGPVRLVSPCPPGGGTATTARVVGPALSEFPGIGANPG